MDNTIGLVAVILSLGFLLGAMYTYYCVRQTAQPGAFGGHGARPRNSHGTGTVARGAFAALGRALGYMATMGIIARFAEPDAWTAAAFGIIPFALGLGFLLTGR